MICEQCGQRPANVHFTEIAQGQKNQYHLCEVCAREKGEAAYQALAGAFSVNQLLSGLLNFDQTGKMRPSTPTAQCDHCGLTFQQFAQIGRFGCPHCYEAFASGLNPLLRRVQSSEQHVGKIPRRRGTTIAAKRELAQLRDEMRQRISEERFEDAAHLRDRIRVIERESSQE